MFPKNTQVNRYKNNFDDLTSKLLNKREKEKKLEPHQNQMFSELIEVNNFNQTNLFRVQRANP